MPFTNSLWLNSDSTTQAMPPCVMQSGHAPRARRASLPCTTVAVHRGAGAKKDSMHFCAIPLWITTGSFISRLVSETHRRTFLGGAQPPASSVQGSCSPPCPPSSYTGGRERGLPSVLHSRGVCGDPPAGNFRCCEAILVHHSEACREAHRTSGEEAHHHNNGGARHLRLWGRTICVCA